MIDYKLQSNILSLWEWQIYLNELTNDNIYTYTQI